MAVIGAQTLRNKMFDLSSQYADFIKDAGTDSEAWTPEQRAISNNLLDQMSQTSNNFDVLASQSNNVTTATPSPEIQKFLTSDIDITNARAAADAAFQRVAELRSSGASSADINAAQDVAFSANQAWESLTSSTPTKSGDQLPPVVYPTTITQNGTQSGTLGEINNGIASVFSPIASAATFVGGVSNTINSVGNSIIGGINGLSSDLFGGPSTSGFQSGGTSGSYGLGGDPRIRIRSKDGNYPGILAPLKETNGMVFMYTPNTNISETTNYTQLATTHGLQDYHLFHTNVATQITIEGPFSAQNKREGEYMLACIHFLRTMNKMRFGQNNPGFPPPVLLLSGYGNYMFNDLPVIITNINVPLPNNVDYLEVVKDNGWGDVPVLTNISVTLIVQNTPKKNRTFDWDKFASGELMKPGAGFI